MFKVFVSLLFALSALAYAADPSNLPKNSTEGPYVYVPKPNFEAIPRERILVRPIPPNQEQGAAQWCDTLRGKGSVALAIGKNLIVINIDCSEDKMKDL